MITEFVNHIRVTFPTLKEANEAIAFMRAKLKESIAHWVSVYDLVGCCSLAPDFSYRFTSMELNDWGWTSIDGFSLEKGPIRGTCILTMPPARIMEEKCYPLTPPPQPYIPRGSEKMIKIIVNKDYQNVQVVSDSMCKLDKLLTYMKRKIYESIGHSTSVLDLYEWVGVSFLDTNAEMMNWVWTSLEEAKIDKNFDNYTLSMPPAKKISLLKLSPYKEMYINIPRGCGKTMTAMKMIEDICKNNKLREEINSKIKKYSDTDFYGYRFLLEYQHKPCEKRYRVEYRIPFDSPCYLEMWPDEKKIETYLNEQENKARKELIDRVIKDINEGDANNMPIRMGLKDFDIADFNNSYMTISSAKVRLPKIVNVEMYNDRVVKVTFDDGSFTKSVCQENDIFDLDVGITICLIKKMLDTGKGNGTRIYNDVIRNAHKLIEDKENEKIEKQMEKEKQKKKAHKAMMKKQAKKMKAKEEAIDTQKQAFIRALQETGMVKDVE